MFDVHRARNCEKILENVCLLDFQIRRCKWRHNVAKVHHQVIQNFASFTATNDNRMRLLCDTVNILIRAVAILSHLIRAVFKPRTFPPRQFAERVAAFAFEIDLLTAFSSATYFNQ
jgi:hypothetical protein